MGDMATSSKGLQNSVSRLDEALARLEQNLDEFVERVRAQSHKTGFDEGFVKGVESGEQLARRNFQEKIEYHEAKNSEFSEKNGILNAELENSKLRERELQGAIHDAKSALDEAIIDIRDVLGSV